MSKIYQNRGGTLTLISDDSDVVHKTGNETIAGTKTFSSTITGSISGNAGTATQFSANTTVALTGDATGTSSGSKKGWSVPVTLANSGVTAGSYGPSADATPAYGATFNVPYITVDAKGRITAASTKTVKIPASDNADVKVTQTVSTDNAELPILTKASNATSTITDTSKFAAAVKINPSTGTLTATKFVGPLTGNVTGNCSGSSGSCTGNAATATKLATARTIAISGGATGTATSFDGSGNITIPVTALDLSKASAGTLPVARGGTGLTSLDTFVRTTGNQTVGGTKTFSAEIMVNKGDKPAAGALSHAFGVTYQNTDGTQTHTAHPISVIGTSNADNAYNTGVRLGSLNGTTVVSAGESGSTFCSTLSKFDDENLYLNADGEIHAYIKCANDMATYAGPIKFSGSANATGGTTSITATSFIGNASTATKLATARTINGVSFDGSANITVADSTKVAKAGDTMTGNLTISKSDPTVCTKSTGMTRNTAPSAAVNAVEILGQDSAGKSTWGIYHTYGTDKSHMARLICYSGITTDNTWSGIGIGYDGSGNAYTIAPTPATADNSTKIATTAYVKSQGYGKAIKGITRSGTTFTYTCVDGTTGTFTQQDNNTTYANFVKSGSGAKNGLVPAPSTTAGTTKYLREDCTWQVPPNTVYTHPTTAGNKHIPAGGSSGQILRWSAAGTAAWGADNNTTYSAATQSAAGLMSAADKKKLDGVTTGAKAYYIKYTGSSQISCTAKTWKTYKAGSDGAIRIVMNYADGGQDCQIRLTNSSGTQIFTGKHANQFNVGLGWAYIPAKNGVTYAFYTTHADTFKFYFHSRE